MTAPLRILIADDDTLVRLIARAVVEKAGMSVIEAADGADALSCLESDHRFDLVLLDLDMPIIGGLDILRRMRARPETARVPVLVLTGADGAEMQTALDLGANGIFPKPIAAERLLARIREVAS
jgi:chemosensory pili system protein ChpA (sensor histidine kinase/response regulator)